MLSEPEKLARLAQMLTDVTEENTCRGILWWLRGSVHRGLWEQRAPTMHPPHWAAGPQRTAVAPHPSSHSEARALPQVL